MPKITSRTRSLTIQQRMILAQNQHLWGAAILEDGSVLCLDRAALRDVTLDQADDHVTAPYILEKSGRLVGVYHYYAQHHGFTFLKPKQQTEPETSPVPPRFRDSLTILEAIDYLSAAHGVVRSRSAIARWLRIGLVESEMGTVAGHYARLIDRHSLDAYILGGNMRQPGNSKRVTPLPPGTTCDRLTAQEANLCLTHE